MLSAKISISLGGLDLLNVGEKAALVGHLDSGSRGRDAHDVDCTSCLLAHVVRVANTLVRCSKLPRRFQRGLVANCDQMEIRCTFHVCVLMQ